MVSVGNFRLTADDGEYPIPADSTVDKTLWLVAATTPQQVVHVTVTDIHEQTIVDQDVTVTVKGTPVRMPKGTNLATVTPSETGPSDRRIGFYLG